MLIILDLVLLILDLVLLILDLVLLILDHPRRSLRCSLSLPPSLSLVSSMARARARAQAPCACAHLSLGKLDPVLQQHQVGIAAVAVEKRYVSGRKVSTD